MFAVKPSNAKPGCLLNPSKAALVKCVLHYIKVKDVPCFCKKFQDSMQEVFLFSSSSISQGGVAHSNPQKRKKPGDNSSQQKLA